MDDALGLSLSLSCPGMQCRNLNRDLLLSALPLPHSSAHFSMNMIGNPLHFLRQQRESVRADVFQSSNDPSAEPRSFLRGIDMNQAITVADCDEEAILSSPNSTVSSVSGKRSEREENDGERSSSSLEIDDNGGEVARKKLRLSKEQAALLEDTFKVHNTLNPKQKLGLAKRLNLRTRQVEVWFQNRRARTKLKQTEVDCEYLRRCCESLTGENRRLQEEVNELRALKLSPQPYMNMNPPTPLTMYPQCVRVTVSSAARH